VADDLLAVARARARANLFWRHLGIDVVDARPGSIRIRLPIRDELCNAAGAPLHGGVVASLIDMAIGGALGTLREAAAGGVDQSSIELNVGFIAAARRGDVFAEGRILKHGRTLAFGEASVTDAEGKLLAIGRATYILLAPRPA
jgi:acyl-CoA thioesterase